MAFVEIEGKLRELRDRLRQTCAAWVLIRDSLDGRLQALQDSMAAIPASARDNVRLYDDLSDRRRAALASRDSASTMTMERVSGAIVAAMVDTVGTGMNAHYKFTRVRPGNYILFGEWRIADSAYKWWAPVTVPAARAVKTDLDNSVEANDALYCGIDT